MSARRSKEERAAILTAKAQRATAEAKAVQDETIRKVLRAHDLVVDAICADGLNPDASVRLGTARMALREALKEMGAPLP